MMFPRRPVSIAVIDVETTGLFPLRHDRVVEVAVVVVRTDGEVEREFVSLVNPARDIGPSSIHGLNSEDICHAPQFGEIAALVVETLQGVVAIAAHNVRFDRQFLEYEFSRMNYSFPNCHSVCTMQLAGGGRLTKCCEDYGISLPGEAHHALSDARAAACLLATIIGDQPSTANELNKLTPVEWPRVDRKSKSPLTRDESRRRQSEAPAFLQRLLRRMENSVRPSAPDGAVLAYEAVLDRILEDRRVDDVEADALLETATVWGLSADQVRSAHSDYLHRLSLAAVADGTVTDAERRDLKYVARLLGHDQSYLDQVLTDAASRLANRSICPSPSKQAESKLSGNRVCFTGELQCKRHGQLISREVATELATSAGLVVVDSVTKKLDLLVLADPHTQSGKATKARQYGIRIMHEPVFWKALGVEVT